MTIVWVFAGLLIYLVAHVRLIGHNSVLATLSMAVGWFFLCQTPAYSSYSGILWNGRWIMLGIVAAHSIASAIVARKPMRLHRWWIVPFMLAPFFLLSSAWSIDPEVTLQRSISIMLIWSMVFGVMWYVVSHSHLVEGVLKAIVLPVVVLYCVLIPIYGFDLSYFEKGFLRSGGSMLNPNVAGELGALLLPISYYLYKTTPIGRRIWLFALWTLGFMVLTSGARGALTATIVPIIIIMFYQRKNNFKFYLIALLATIGSFVGLGLLDTPDIFNKYLRVESLEMIGGRKEAWQVAWQAFMERPFLGYGFGTEDQIFDHLGSQFSYHHGAMVHNSYLGLALQVGFLGAIVLFLPLFFVGLTGIRKSLLSGEHLTVSLRVAVMVALMIALNESWVYSAGNALAVPFWVIFGLLTGLLQSQQRQIRPQLSHTTSFGRASR